jgi:hypothetical protein
LNAAAAKQRSVAERRNELARLLYRRPTVVLTAAEYDAYMAKLRPFNVWEPEIMIVEDIVAVDTEPGKFERMTVDAYNALPRPRSIPPSRWLLFAHAGDRRNEYLWEHEKRAVAAQDDIDRAFVAKNTQAFRKLELYGLHNYGG